MRRKERISETTTTTMAEVKTTQMEVTTDSIDAALIFHVFYDVLAFLLYMHQQIPSMLQDMTLQFDSLQTEHKELEIVLTENEHDASFRRKNLGRKREVKLEIRRFEKLMNTVSSLRTAFQLLLCEVPNVQHLVFVFGASPRRPQHVYEICFSNERIGFPASKEMQRTRVIEVVSRKVIRALISKGVGSTSYSGPSKLFLLVKAPASFNMPLHFLPKREFQCTKKIVPFRLELKPRICRRDDASCCLSASVAVFSEQQPVSGDLMWFQCRHAIKGLALGNPTPEE